MLNDTPIWKPVAGREGSYAVSSDGDVRSVPRRLVNALGHGSMCRGGPLKGHYNGHYLQVCFSAHGVCEHPLVHHLVAAAFIGPRPEGHVVNHKNGIKTDNRAENLEYVTPSENNHHASRTGLMARGTGHYNARLTEGDVATIRSLKGSVSKRKLAVRFGVHPSTIGGIWSRREWKHVP